MWRLREGREGVVVIWVWNREEEWQHVRLSVVLATTWVNGMKRRREWCGKRKNERCVCD